MSESIEAVPAAPGELKTPEKSAYEKLKPRFRRFVDDIVMGETGVQAAKNLGFGGEGPRFYASKLRKRPDIRAAIEERETEAMETAGITRTRTWIEVGRIAYFDPAKLVGPNGEHLPLHELDEDTRAAIAGVEVEELFEGTGRDRVRIGDIRKYRLSSKLDANKLILQRMGELVDKHEVAGPNGAPLQAAAPVLNLTLTGDVKQSDQPVSATEAEPGVPL